MTSKRQNMFYQNKKQETTEIEMQVDWEDKLEEELASKDAQIQELKMRLKCLQIPVNDEDTNDTRERILDLSGDTEKIIQQLLSLEMAYRDSLNENRKLENSLEEANSQLERSKEKQEEERAVIEALEARNDELDRQLLILNRNQSDYEQLKASLRSMQCDIKKLSKKNRMLCAKYLNLKVRYHHFKSKPDEDANRSWFSKVLSRVW
ncbi:hypothetical protein AAG570_005631 [Ranatra chinensis]|uniref:Uncharacterized protein n=1 Tax=Ranatra chinensis TaxID=642074 RepID=A0ABD0XY02_9HEMI